jgi:RNA polymerase sigma-70 factor (ECF subfamily)
VRFPLPTVNESGRRMASSSDKTRVFLENFLKAESRVYAYIRSQIVHKSDAEDVVQETAVTLWEKFDEFQPDTNFLAWAYQIARFKVQHYYKKRTRQHRLFSDAFVELLAKRMEGMEDELADLETYLATCMERLPVADCEVVKSCYASDATIAKVSEQIGRPVGTIKNVLKRSRRALFECISRSLRREEQRP